MKKSIILLMFLAPLLVKSQLQETNGNVGIGTSNPNAKLEVFNSGDQENDLVIRSSSSATGSARWSRLSLQRSGDANQGFLAFYGNNSSGLNLGVTGSNPVRFFTNDSERIRISADGKVGIGTTNPNFNLEVAGTSAAQIGINSINYNTYRLISWTSADKFSIYDNADATHRLVIDGDGNVGIGTNNPATQLEVSKGFSFGSSMSTIPSYMAGYSNSSNPEITALVSGSAGGTLMEAGGYGQFVIGIRDNNNSDGFHILSTSESYTGQLNGVAAPYNKLVASFLADGNVGIGTNNPATQLEVSKGFSFGSSMSTIPSYMAGYSNSSNPEITALVSGSTGGTLMEAGGYGQFVIGIRDNNGTDGFHILSTSENYAGQLNGVATPYNKLVASFLANGNVGIGTNNPDSRLTVAGEVHSQEVIVTVNAGADFVFDASYELRTLE